MRKNLVRYQDDDYNVELEVGQATIAMGLARSDLWFETRALVGKDKSLVMRVGILQTFPACMAATISVTNLPKLDAEGEVVRDESGEEVLYPQLLSMSSFTLDAFLALPEALGVIWKDAVFALNPHWLPVLPEEEEEAGEVEEPSKERS